MLSLVELESLEAFSWSGEKDLEVRQLVVDCVDGGVKKLVRLLEVTSGLTHHGGENPSGWHPGLWEFSPEAGKARLGAGLDCGLLHGLTASPLPRWVGVPLVVTLMRVDATWMTLWWAFLSRVVVKARAPADVPPEASPCRRAPLQDLHVSMRG